MASVIFAVDFRVRQLIASAHLQTCRELEHCNDDLAEVGGVGCPSLAGRHCARDLHHWDPEHQVLVSSLFCLLLIKYLSTVLAPWIR